MLIEDLPRLTDEERELADDEFVVMPAAVPTNLSIDDLVVQHTAALYAMRTAGADFAAFSAASREEAQLAVQIRRVRRDAAQAEIPVQSWICPTCKSSGLDPSEGSYCPTCEGTGSAPSTGGTQTKPAQKSTFRRVTAALAAFGARVLMRTTTV